MSFIRYKGKTKLVYAPVTPSTAITAGALVTFSSGKLIAATSSTAAVDIFGVIRHTIASTDSDYASDRLVEVEVPVDRYTQWTCDVTSGLVTTDVGLEVDLTDSLNVNRTANSVKVVKALRRLSATKGIFMVKFNGSY